MVKWFNGCMKFGLQSQNTHSHHIPQPNVPTSHHFQLDKWQRKEKGRLKHWILKLKSDRHWKELWGHPYTHTHAHTPTPHSPRTPPHQQTKHYCLSLYLFLVTSYTKLSLLTVTILDKINLSLLRENLNIHSFIHSFFRGPQLPMALAGFHFQVGSFMCALLWVVLFPILVLILLCV